MCGPFRTFIPFIIISGMVLGTYINVWPLSVNKILSNLGFTKDADIDL